MEKEQEEPPPPPPPLPNWREGYSSKEREILQLFRTEVASMRGVSPEDEDLSDHFLIRWLRARNLDIARAKTMLAHYYEWKSEHNFPDCIHPSIWTSPDVIRNDIIVQFFGDDSDGRPVIWAPVGRWEVRKRLEEGLKEQLVLHVYSIFKSVLDRIDEARTQRGVTQVVGILDMAELSFRKLSIETMQATTRFFREFEAYFPEIVTTVYVINAPMVFSFVYNFVKPFMSAATLEKIKVYGYNESSWKPVLAEKFPAQILPKEYGGDGPPVFAAAAASSS